MRVLVTGGTGFVGSRIAAGLLQRGDTVRILRRENSSLVGLEGLCVEHVIGDVLDPDAVAKAVAGCDLVFHVAAISSYWRSQRDKIYRVYVEGTRTVMTACLAAGVPRVVHTSSLAAIGIPPAGTLATEATSFDALSASFAYGDSKHRAEHEVYAAIERGLAAVIVNPGIVVGAGDHYLGSGSMVLEFARHTMPAVPPGGACVADVDAVVAGHLAAAACGRPGERYILGGENLTYRQIATTIVEVAGRRTPRWTIPRWLLGPAASAVDVFNRVSARPPMISGEQIRLSALEFYCDSSKAVRELNYPLLPFRGAVEKAYAWYQEHRYLN